MMIKTKSKYKKAFTMVELMLLLVVFSLILASSFSVITRKHKLKPTRAMHGEYLCFYDANLKDADGNQISGGGNHEIYYQGNSKILDGPTPNNGKENCSFNLPSNATYYLVRMVGGGGAGGNANYAPDKDDVTSFDIGKKDPIVVNLIKGTVQNGVPVGGGDVMAFQPYFGLSGCRVNCKGRGMITEVKEYFSSEQDFTSGITIDYVNNKFKIDGNSILSANTFRNIVDDFFGGNDTFRVTAYDYAGSGQSGITVQKARGLEERNCKGSNNELAECFNKYVKDIGLVTETTGKNPFYTDGCVAIGNGELTDELLGNSQQARENNLARYCPIFFNDYWIPSQDQGNFHICESGKGGRGAMFTTRSDNLKGFRYGLSAVVGNRMNIDFYQEPVQNYRYDTVPSILPGAVTKGSFSPCNNSTDSDCNNFTKKDGSNSQYKHDDAYINVPKLDGANYDFSRAGFLFPEVSNLVRLTYAQQNNSPLADDAQIPQGMLPRPGSFPYFQRLGTTGGEYNQNQNKDKRIYLFYNSATDGTLNSRAMAYAISNEFGNHGENLNDLENSWCTGNAGETINYDNPDGTHESGQCQYIGQFRGCPSRPLPADNGTLNDSLSNDNYAQLSKSLCIANLRFYAPNRYDNTRGLAKLRANLNLHNKYRDADGNPSNNVSADDKYDSTTEYTQTLLPFQCRPFSEPYNVYKNAGFIDSPEPLNIAEDEFALKFQFLHNNKIMTYGEPGNPGEYREFYTRATSSNRLYIQPGQGGRPEEVTDETLGNTETIYSNFINRNPITVAGRDPQGGDTNIFFNCQTDKEKENVINANTCQNHIAHGNAGGRSGLLDTKDELIYSQAVASNIAQRLAQGNLGEHPFPRYSYNASIDNDSDFFERVKNFVSQYISNRQDVELYKPGEGKGAQTRFSIISELLNIPKMDNIISNFGKGGDAGYGWDDCWIGQRVLLMYMPQNFNDYTKYNDTYVYVKGTHFSQLKDTDISACKTGDNWWGNKPGENGGGGAVLITW